MSDSAPLIDWKPKSLPNGVHVAIPDEATFVVMGDASSARVVSGFRPVRVGVWYGTSNDLAAWRDGIGRNPGVQFGSENDSTVCHKPARALEASTPDLPPTYVMDHGGQERVEENPAETYVAVAFEHAGEPIVVFYVVATAKRADHADDEKHFFASIICPDA